MRWTMYRPGVELCRTSLMTAVPRRARARDRQHLAEAELLGESWDPLLLEAHGLADHDHANGARPRPDAGSCGSRSWLGLATASLPASSSSAAPPPAGARALL